MNSTALIDHCDTFLTKFTVCSCYSDHCAIKWKQAWCHCACDRTRCACQVCDIDTARLDNPDSESVAGRFFFSPSLVSVCRFIIIIRAYYQRPSSYVSVWHLSWDWENHRVFVLGRTHHPSNYTYDLTVDWSQRIRHIHAVFVCWWAWQFGLYKYFVRFLCSQLVQAAPWFFFWHWFAECIGRWFLAVFSDALFGTGPMSKMKGKNDFFVRCLLVVFVSCVGLSVCFSVCCNCCCCRPVFVMGMT